MKFTDDKWAEYLDEIGYDEPDEEFQKVFLNNDYRQAVEVLEEAYEAFDKTIKRNEFPETEDEINKDEYAKAVLDRDKNFFKRWLRKMDKPDNQLALIAGTAGHLPSRVAIECLNAFIFKNKKLPTVAELHDKTKEFYKKGYRMELTNDMWRTVRNKLNLAGKLLGAPRGKSV
ncbi:hypothetical protein N8631_01695 [Verrucomicrobiales bacterium]|nr:hypothetical protein [Verrucomicrobiales bacterium]